MTSCSELFRSVPSKCRTGWCSANRGVPNPLVIQNGGTPPVVRNPFLGFLAPNPCGLLFARNRLHRLDTFAGCEARANHCSRVARLHSRRAYKTHYRRAEIIPKCNAVSDERLVTDHSHTCFLTETNAVASLWINI